MQMASKSVPPIRPQSTAALDRIELAAGAISMLSELRAHLEDAKVNEGSEYFVWFDVAYGAAIGAGIAALAQSIEGDLNVADNAMATPASAVRQ
jgi:hypothetical protein